MWVFAGWLVMAPSTAHFAAPPQAEPDVSPEATPEIRQLKPTQAAAGGDVTVMIEGRNFSAGAYVSFSTPAVHAVSTRRVSATQLEVRLAVGKKAEPGTISLYVSNPASSVAEAPFTIRAHDGPTTTPPGPDLGASAPPLPSIKVEGAQTAQPAAPATTATPAGQPRASQPGAPEVTKVDPPRAGKGSELAVKISGKNLARGAKVAFSNPGIRVLETQVGKSSELTVRIQIAPDAAAGPSGLFVVNPDDSETEASFIVTDEAPTKATSATTPPTAPAPASQPAAKTSDKSSAESLHFEVMSLADVGAILQKGNRPKGTLSLGAGKIRYEESGKEVFAEPVTEIKEIAENLIVGMSTGTFHIILNSGQTYNFIAASLRPADSQSIVQSLRGGLK